MKLTAKQKTALLPYVQKIVQGQIDMWNNERDVESVLDASFDGMDSAAEHLTVRYDHGTQITLDDVQGYIDACVIDDCVIEETE